jgi:hypothetical protein
MTIPAESGPERLYCLAYCPHREHVVRTGGQATCPTMACPLRSPHLVRRPDGCIVWTVDGTEHLISDIPQLLDLRFAIQVYQEGPAIYTPGTISAVRDETPTGTAYQDAEGVAVILQLYDAPGRAWAAIPAHLERLAAGKIPLIEVKEIPGGRFDGGMYS